MERSTFSLLSHVNDQSYPLNDAHIYFGLNACNDNKAKITFIKSLNQFLHDENNKNTLLKTVKSDILLKIFKSIEHFDRNEFDEVVEVLYPIKYDLIKLGGSNAQRDIFNQILVQAALRSNSEFNKKIGISLLNERKVLIPNSKIFERMASRFASVHEFD